MSLSHNLSHKEQVEAILSSEEATDWLLTSGLMQRELSDSEVRIGLPERTLSRSILGVDLTEEQYQTYLRGWNREHLAIPVRHTTVGHTTNTETEPETESETETINDSNLDLYK